MPALKKKPKAVKSVTPPPEPKSIKYEQIAVSICKDEKAITAEQAKKLLGWHEETDNAKADGSQFKGDYDLVDMRGNKIRLLSNTINRSIYTGVVDRIKQEILRSRWKFNGEPVIIGKYGAVLNGQHSLIGLVLAQQTWQDNRSFRDDLESEPVMAKLIVYGVEEDDETVNTMDTCKPRSLADVFYRSEFFKDIQGGSRKRLARIANFGVRELWERTGASRKKNKYRTHAESIDFLQRHPRLLECIKHVYEENCGKAKKIETSMPLGEASACLYLMGSCATEREKEDGTGYSDTSSPNESFLDWEFWDKACEFFVMLGAEDRKLLPFRQARGSMMLQGTYRNEDRLVLMAKTWELWSAGEVFEMEDVHPEYKEVNGVLALQEKINFGGIDLGGPVPD